MLRPLTPFDLEALYSTLDGEVVRWQGYPSDPVERHKFVRDWVEYADLGDRRNLQWLICDRLTGEVVGHRSLVAHVGKLRGQACETGSSLKDGWREKGYGTEELQAVLRLVEEHLGYGIVIAGTAPDNHRALAQYQKCGFNPDGVKPGHPLPNGQTVDAVLLRRKVSARRTCRQAVTRFT